MIKLKPMKGDDEGPSRPRSIPHGPELSRILALPRRDIPDVEAPENIELAAYLTRSLKHKSVENVYPGPLRPVQALALKEAWENKGLFAPLAAGSGKMLLSFLLPFILESQRPLLMLPKKMEAETLREFDKYRATWKGHSRRTFSILSYELLSCVSSDETFTASGQPWKPARLTGMRPDLIILDECHMCSNMSSALVRRLVEHMEDFPETMVVAMSGTPFKTSIKDAMHVMEWTLKERTPLPRAEFFEERESWSGFLDPKGTTFRQTDIGMLTLLAKPDEVRPGLRDVSGWRRVVSRRIMESPGVIGTQEPPTDIPITVSPWYPIEEDPKVNELITRMRVEKALPDGNALGDREQIHRHLSTVARGHWQKWDPAPPQSWRDARSAFASFSRKVTGRHRSKYVSEGAVKVAIRAGRLDDGGLLNAWETEIHLERGRTFFFEPPSVMQWETDEVVHSLRAWLKEYKSGLIWTENVEFGATIADRLGLQYYGAEGKTTDGKIILNHTPGVSAVASIQASGTGKNLQRIWHRAMWLCAPNEQALARLHRPGQPAQSVDNWLYLGAMAHLNAFIRARDVVAQFAEDMTGMPQKLKYAMSAMPTVYELASRPGIRWEPKQADID